MFQSTARLADIALKAIQSKFFTDKNHMILYEIYGSSQK